MAAGTLSSLPSTDERRETLRQWMEHWAAATPDGTALLEGEDRVSYAELHRRAVSLAGFFHAVTIGPNEVTEHDEIEGERVLRESEKDAETLP